jgi:hypothetical protein
VNHTLDDAFGTAPPIYPYSVRAGYETLKTKLERHLVRGTLSEFENNRAAILRRKLKTLLRECSDYLALALRSADAVGQERESLNHLIKTEKESLDEVKSELRLIVNHAAGSTRAELAKRFNGHQKKIQDQLLSDLDEKFPHWTQSLRSALESFEQWLRDSLTSELLATSSEERLEALLPLQRLRKEVFRTLQHFRDRLSDRTERAFGLPLRTTEPEIVVDEPRTPDIYIGKVFDRNWELLSPVVPMSLLKPLVRRHFIGKVPYMVEKNLSRLTTQWDESIRTAMINILQESQRRLDELIETVERLLATTANGAPAIRTDLERVNLCLDKVEATENTFGVNG